MNPYKEDEHEIKTISALHIPKEWHWKRPQYLKYFSEKTGYAVPYVALKLTGMQDDKTLAYIKSDCDKYELEGKGSWGRAFNALVKRS